MKLRKMLLALGLGLFISQGAVFSQVLESPSFVNTLWTGFGKPKSSSDLRYPDVIDIMQARVDYRKVMMEGMLNWNLLSNYDSDGKFHGMNFGMGNKCPLFFLGHDASLESDGAYVLGNSFYVNFVINPVADLYFGAGSKFEWNVGAAPSCGISLLFSNAHESQGGLSTAFDPRKGQEVVQI